MLNTAPGALSLAKNNSPWRVSVTNVGKSVTVRSWLLSLLSRVTHGFCCQRILRASRRRLSVRRFIEDRERHSRHVRWTILTLRLPPSYSNGDKARGIVADKTAADGLENVRDVQACLGARSAFRPGSQGRRHQSGPCGIRSGSRHHVRGGGDAEAGGSSREAGVTRERERALPRWEWPPSRAR